MRKSFAIGGDKVPPGTRRIVEIPISLLSNHTPISLPVQVIHGRRDGPKVFVSAAVHGDEIIGVEIIRRLSRSAALRGLSGTLVLIPIVNAFGFISHSRYLPDRRDLNRSFPGSQTGSLASQLAYRFLNDVVSLCDFGIDLHSAAAHRVNLPQIRISADDTTALELARAFEPPVIVQAELRDGSLRAAAAESGVPLLLYEAGEALRLDEFSARVGVKGILKVLKHLGMIRHRSLRLGNVEPPLVRKMAWVRAPEGGIFRTLRVAGDIVRKGESLGYISDPFGEKELDLKSPYSGLVVGRSNLPAVNQGDALYNIAQMPRKSSIEGAMEAIEEEFENDPLLDEDEIL
ncbi:succinylglutamate desuccinylase/aspartoacylase family protein [Nisaea sp.]|uniref:succinylglutamate desuccinylase/aspartoacylase family protein n=1 Tax=Nisaea sp. TaxID=2024842 RepID=UPI003B52288B